MSKTAFECPLDATFLLEKGFDAQPIGNLDKSQRLALLELRNAPDIRKNMYDDQPISQQTHLEWCEEITNSRRDHIYGVLDGDQVVGQFGLRAISWLDRRCDWGFFIAEWMRGRGLGGAIERTVLRHVFEGLRFQKLNCEVIEFNKGVIEIHKKFGFRVEGVRRSHVLRYGSALDVVCLGILCDEVG